MIQKWSNFNESMPSSVGFQTKNAYISQQIDSFIGCYALSPPHPGQQIFVAVGQLSHRERRLGDPVDPARNGPEKNPPSIPIPQTNGRIKGNWTMEIGYRIDVPSSHIPTHFRRPPFPSLFLGCFSGLPHLHGHSKPLHAYNRSLIDT